jgi:hypothetical protein
MRPDDVLQGSREGLSRFHLGLRRGRRDVPADRPRRSAPRDPAGQLRQATVVGEMRMVTLEGLSGLGKSTLAPLVARRLAAESYRRSRATSTRSANMLMHLTTRRSGTRSTCGRSPPPVSAPSRRWTTRCGLSRATSAARWPITSAWGQRSGCRRGRWCPSRSCRSWSRRGGQARTDPAARNTDLLATALRGCNRAHPRCLPSVWRCRGA